jgi:hypothetical protein
MSAGGKEISKASEVNGWILESEIFNTIPIKGIWSGSAREASRARMKWGVNRDLSLVEAACEERLQLAFVPGPNAAQSFVNVLNTSKSYRRRCFFELPFN